MQLPTLTPFLCSYAPIALLLFIILHEKTLQRNAITLCSITPTQATNEDWLDTILRCSLTAINTNTSVIILIEHKDALDYFLTAPFIINANIEKNILDILIASASYDDQKMIWITTHGTIRSINVDWLTNTNNKDNQFNACFYTTQSDALVLQTHPIHRTFTLIMQGKEIKNLSAHQVLTLIKKQLSFSYVPYHKGAYRENNRTEKSTPD